MLPENNNPNVHSVVFENKAARLTDRDERLLRPNISAENFTNHFSLFLSSIEIRVYNLPSPCLCLLLELVPAASAAFLNLLLQQSVLAFIHRRINGAGIS